MYETLEKYHKILQKENLRAAPDKTYFILKKVKFLGHIIENKKIKPLTSRIEGKFRTTKQHEITSTIFWNHKFLSQICIWNATHTTNPL